MASKLDNWCLVVLVVQGQGEYNPEWRNNREHGQEGEDLGATPV